MWIKNKNKNVQDNVGWGVGLGVLAGVLALALALFLLGIKRYRKESPTGSPFTRLAQVFVATARKWRVQHTLSLNHFCYSEDDKVEPHHLHVQPKYHTLLHTRQYRLLSNFNYSLLNIFKPMPHVVGWVTLMWQILVHIIAFKNFRFTLLHVEKSWLD